MTEKQERMDELEKQVVQLEERLAMALVHIDEIEKTLVKLSLEKQPAERVKEVRRQRRDDDEG